VCYTSQLESEREEDKEMNPLQRLRDLVSSIKSKPNDKRIAKVKILFKNIKLYQSSFKNDANQIKSKPNDKRIAKVKILFKNIKLYQSSFKNDARIISRSVLNGRC